jgi:mRNA-degrading endonuclease HigB of HigAB toxin-antitoxin module
MEFRKRNVPNKIKFLVIVDCEMSSSEVKNDGWSTPASIKETFGQDGIKIRNTPGKFWPFVLTSNVS